MSVAQSLEQTFALAHRRVGIADVAAKTAAPTGWQQSSKIRSLVAEDRGSVEQSLVDAARLAARLRVVGK
jgi:hypothetical protein